MKHQEVSKSSLQRIADNLRTIVMETESTDAAVVTKEATTSDHPTLAPPITVAT